MNKQVLDQQSLVSDKTVNKNSVLESAKCVEEVTESQKVLALAVEEGSGLQALQGSQRISRRESAVSF